MNLAIISALADNNVIGNAGKIPWHNLEKWKDVTKADLARFKQLTLGHPVIMGRKTYESILDTLGKPLPKRTNIVTTRNQDYTAQEGVIVAHSRYEATQRAFEKTPNGTAFVIGGAQVYKEFMPFTSSMRLTRINEEFEGDTFFPKINKDDWVFHDKDIQDFGTHIFIDYLRRV